MIRLPTFADPFYSVTYELAEERFVFDYLYNQREDAWYIHVITEDGVVIARGIRVSVGVDLLRFCVTSRVPKGILVCVGPRDPGLKDLTEDGTCQLVFE
jgi:hypothetical protein